MTGQFDTGQQDIAPYNTHFIQFSRMAIPDDEKKEISMHKAET
jgi:hypothetical protein